MRLLRFQRKLDDEKGAGLLGLSLQVHIGAELLILDMCIQTSDLCFSFYVDVVIHLFFSCFCLFFLHIDKLHYTCITLVCHNVVTIILYLLQNN